MTSLLRDWMDVRDRIKYRAPYHANKQQQAQEAWDNTIAWVGKYLAKWIPTSSYLFSFGPIFNTVTTMHTIQPSSVTSRNPFDLFNFDGP